MGKGKGRLRGRDCGIDGTSGPLEGHPQGPQHAGAAGAAGYCVGANKYVALTFPKKLPAITNKRIEIIKMINISFICIMK
jgi:hypothetical protein